MGEIRSTSGAGPVNMDGRSLTAVVLALIGIVAQFVLPIWKTEGDEDWGVASESLGRSDVGDLLSLAGESHLPLYMGIAGLAVSALIVLAVPRAQNFRGPLASVAALVSLYLPIGLSMSADLGLGESVKFFGVGMWVAVASMALVALMGLVALRDER